MLSNQSSINILNLKISINLFFLLFLLIVLIQDNCLTVDIPSICYNDNCCSGDEFRCGNGSCIPLTNVCENSHDAQIIIYLWRESYCPDSSDGVGCSDKPCELRGSKCDYSCLNLPGNKSRCMCNKGYELQSRKKMFQCVDIDECKDGDQMCSQECKNTNGSFDCICKNGFTKRNGKFEPCVADDNNVTVLYNSNSRIYSYNIKSRQRSTVAWSGIVEDIEYDPTVDMFYWTRENIVFRSFLPGAMNGTVTVAHAQTLGSFLMSDRKVRNRLSVDWVLGYLYWLSSDIKDKNKTHVMLSTLDGRYVKTVFSIPFGNSIALDPERGLMFWSAGGPNPKIFKGGMNGVIFWVLLETPGQNPNCLSYDRFSERLYWVDSTSGSIFFILRSNRGARKVFTTSRVRNPIAMDIFENYIYWLTESSNELVRLDKFGRGSAEVLVSNLINSTSLRIYYKKIIDPKFGHIKNDKECMSCSHICLRSYNFAQCVCPDGSKPIYFKGEMLCSSETLRPIEDPLICNCAEKDKICNSTTDYRFCACGIKCPDGLGVPDYNDIPEAPVKRTSSLAWKIIAILVACCLFIACLYYGYTKRTFVYNRYYN